MTWTFRLDQYIKPIVNLRALKLKKIIPFLVSKYCKGNFLSVKLHKRAQILSQKQ